MRYLLLSLFVFQWSCASFVRDFEPAEPVVVQIDNPYFSDVQKDYVYKANFRFYKKNFGGIFIVKKLDPGHHLILLLTEFGNKILEFESKEGTVEPLFVLQELNKKPVLNALKRDFRTLVEEHRMSQLKYRGNDFDIYKSDDSYYYLANDVQLYKIVRARGNRKRVTFDFEESSSDLAKKITWTHHDYNFSAQLLYLGN
jgi:hypothetical protein